MRLFTLIETLIYLALFSILIIGAIASLIAMQENMARIDAQARLTDEGNFVLERLRYEVERANVITADGSHISVESDTGTLSFFFQDNSLFEEVADNSLPLTEPTTQVSDVLFKRDGRAVSILFTLSLPTNEGPFVTDTFSESLYLPQLP